jgi:formate hydrogenlyase subunit 6/NADH:ubiquinone oxidoreductase subunit I
MKWPGRMAAEVLRHVAQKPATLNYPAEKVTMPADYRGKIVFHAARCVGCKLCQKDCPACALRIEKVSDKRFRAVFELDRCIYCAQCVDSCNKDALESTRDFELATLDRKDLHVVFEPAPLPAVATPPAPAAAAAPAGAPPGRST